MTREPNIEDVQEPITTAPQEVRQIIERVWQLEKSRLDRKSLSHINDDILAIVKEVVK
jgi:predicted Ser/Thr protein kinase